MKLDNVQLENFRSWERSQLSLGSRLTLFIGENGSGKTAVLDAIAIGLGEVLTRLPEVSGITFRKHGEIQQVENQLKPYTRITLTTTGDVVWDRVKRRYKRKHTAQEIENGMGEKAIREIIEAKVMELWKMGESIIF